MLLIQHCLAPLVWCSSPLFSKSDESLDENEKCQKQNLLKQCQEEKALIKKGYQRVEEKLKEIRQNFSAAVATGHRSGSGKIVRFLL